MAASDHLNGQLRMFMSPRELGAFVDNYGDYGPNPGGLPHEAMESMTGNFDRTAFKTDNLVSSGMGPSIERDGVKKPLDVAFDPKSGEHTLFDGHHRLLKQSRANPDRLMPILYTTAGQHPSDDMARQAHGLTLSQNRDPTGDQR